MTKTLTQEQQLHLASAIISAATESAIRLNALIRSKIENNYEPIPPQHIKQDVEAVHGAIIALSEVLTGKVEFKLNPALETTSPSPQDAAPTESKSQPDQGTQ